MKKLSDFSKGFKSPEFNPDKEYISLKVLLDSKASTNWLNPLLKIAAVLLIGFSIFYYNTTLDTKIKTDIAQEITLSLPDASTVELNAQTTLTYNKKSWSDKRDISLNGEAFFKVAKGSKFRVITTDGIVSVLGTQFNINQRDEYFEVTCYEGLVKVNYESDSLNLKPGQRFLILNGTIKNEIVYTKSPSWLSNESTYKNRPLKFILDELERQYDISIDRGNINLDVLATGGFPHNNLDLALKLITSPLGITYSNNNAVIVLRRE